VLTGNPGVTATRNSTGFTVVATGYSNTWEIRQVMFLFNAAAGQTLQAPYCQSAASNATARRFQADAAVYGRRQHPGHRIGDRDSDQHGGQFEARDGESAVEGIIRLFPETAKEQFTHAIAA